MMFRYLADPLFLIAVGIYLINRLCLEPLLEFEFFHSYLNDLICIPFLVPPMLAVARRSSLRSHDLPPTTSEIVIPVIIWSIMFEILLPLSDFWRQWITGDPYDILCYATGAAIAAQVWQFYYQQSPVTANLPPARSLFFRPSKNKLRISKGNACDMPSRRRREIR